MAGSGLHLMFWWFDKRGYMLRPAAKEVTSEFKAAAISKSEFLSSGYPAAAAQPVAPVREDLIEQRGESIARV